MPRSRGALISNLLQSNQALENEIAVLRPQRLYQLGYGCPVAQNAGRQRGVRSRFHASAVIDLVRNRPRGIRSDHHIGIDNFVAARRKERLHFASTAHEAPAQTVLVDIPRNVKAHNAVGGLNPNSQNPRL